ncbi:MAG: endonuclease/exonuclease/phosphatase family protein [Acidimicrobiales bacterium]
MRSTELRVATFNLLHGRSLIDGRVMAERLARACRRIDADVLCIQEVDRSQRRSAGRDQTALAAEAMGAQWWRFEPALVGEPGATWRAAVDSDALAGSEGQPLEPAYGVGLISRREVTDWEVVRLAAAPTRAPVFVPGEKGRFILLTDEPRVALTATINGPDGVLRVTSTHLSFFAGWNVAQLRRLLGELRTPGSRARGAPAWAPVPPTTSPVVARSANGGVGTESEAAVGEILAGDLNLPRWVVRPLAARAGWRMLVEARTFPVGRPSLQVDHVLARGPVGRVVAARTMSLDLSDHLALVVDIEVGVRR